MKQVKVILKQDVYNLGEEGDVREVAAGYARNFLVPQGLALSYSRQNIVYFDQRRESIEKRKEEKREEAQSFRERIESKVLEIEVPTGTTGKLFGSVNSATIADKLAAEGITIERKKIDVPDSSIKMVGEHEVRIRLYGDEVANIKVIIYPVGGKKPAAAGTAETEPRQAAEPAGGIATDSAADTAADTAADAVGDTAADAASDAVGDTAADAASDSEADPTADKASGAEQPVDSDSTADAAAADAGETISDAEEQDRAEKEAEEGEGTVSRGLNGNSVS